MSMLTGFNLAATLLLAALAGAVVLNPRIKEGVVIRVGLTGMVGGLCMLAYHMPTALPPDATQMLYALRALAAIFGGLVVALAGLVLRVATDPAARQVVAQVSGWGELEGDAAHRA